MAKTSHTQPQALNVWLQGMSSDPGPHARDWKETLFRRLVLDYAELGSGGKTRSSEIMLGLEPHTYFSVNCRYPDYDGQVVAFRAGPGLPESARISPFDTGGIVRGKTPIKAGYSDTREARAELVHRHSTDFATAESDFFSWVNAAYPKRGLYESNIRPSEPRFVSEVDVDNAIDARAWSWEARLEIQPLSDADGLAPVRVYLTPSEYTDYVDWVTLAYSSVATEHLDFVATIYQEEEYPVDKMLSDLEDGLWQ